MEIVVNGRHCEVSDRFREHAEEKLTRLEKYDDRIIRVDVEICKERNPRQGDRSCRVELTLRSKGPVVRAEAAAEDNVAALDLALDRLLAQARKAADRRRVHHGMRTPTSLAQAMSGRSSNGAEASTVLEAVDDMPPAEYRIGSMTVHGDGPMVVREKTHTAVPMTLDQALYEMELVGHDFYLFVDKESDRPSVVYRRRGYDYGVIRLAV